ncbi:5-hydroxytryptamine receptor 6-like [Rhopilema esculentum]|uniref:5-hydroxytryptamine receptor 6-like n=1 Tax=Rhopilema esculentum TaxID=499914 RepID=UPI0031D200C3
MKCTTFPPVTPMSPATIYVLVIVNMLTAISSVLINFCFIVGIFSKEALVTTTNILVASLSLSDFLVGLVTQPMFFTHLLLNGRSCMVGDLTFATLGVFCGASGLCLPLISLDRYIRMRKLQYYSRYVTKTRVAVVISVAWVNASIMAFMPMYGVSLVVFYIFLIAYMIFITFIMIMAYISIIHHSRRKVSANTPKSTSTATSAIHGSASGTINAWPSRISKDSKRNESEYSRQMKLTVTVTILVAVAVLSWLPAFVIWLLWALWVPASSNSTIMVTLYYVAASLGFAVSTMNPLLYCWRIREIRRASIDIMWKILRCGQ